MQTIFDKIKRNGMRFNGLLPQSRMKNDGSYYLAKGGNWTDGFYIGVFNLAFALSGDSEFRKFAGRYDDFLDLRIQNTQEINEKYNFLKLDHDVGMIFLPSSGFGFTTDRNDKDRSILISAANVLAERFNEKGNFIRAWDTWKWDKNADFIREKKGKAIIDSMMNIPLLFKAAEMTGLSHYYDIGLKHAQTLAKHIVREDFSTFHTFNFDFETGEPLGGKTQQGFSDDSCWSRGQAWAIYGFALAYKYTKNPSFLTTAIETAEYFMNHLTSVDIPCWDFATNDLEFAPWDSSASAICASGLLELWEQTGNEKFKGYALRLLTAIEKFCLTDKYEKCEPLILHGCSGPVYTQENPSTIINSTINQALVYADYFYMECQLKLSDNKLSVF